MAGEKNKNSRVPLAIVGIGCLFPKANNPEQYWANIREGVDAIGDIPDTHWKVSDYFDANQATPDMTYARRGGFIDAVDFNPLMYGMSPNNIEATDTTQLLGMVVAREALLDAGYSTARDAGDGREFNRDRTSVIMGVTGTLELVIPLGARLGHPIWRKALQDAGIDPETTEDVVQRIADGYVPWQENSFPGLLGNVAAGRIANRFDLGGTNCVVDAACASSLSAIHLAALELSAGRVDMAITGGMDTFNDIFMYMCFSKTPALSPTGNSRPFAKDGDGTILGEGLGAVIMKRLDDAKRDGDKIYAILKGMGSSSDGRGNAIYAPSSDGQTKALWNAYHEADVSPRSIELVEAHGTGTSVGDAVEARALSGVYSSDNTDETWCAIGSVKSMIGHTKAAAGVAGLIKTALALQHKVLPPTIKVDAPLEILNPGSAPIYLNTIKRPWIKKLDTPRRAALSSFGFGGSNFHCVLEEAQTHKADIDWDGSVLLLALSAQSKDELLGQLPGADITGSWNALRFYCYDSCQSFNPEADKRLLLVLEKDKTDVQQLIDDVSTRINKDADSDWHTSSAFYGAGKASDKMAFLFPGQGSQYVGMLRDLVCQFPQCFNMLQRSNDDFADANSGKSLTDVIYPIPVFSAADQKQQEETLRQTQHAQPAIGAVSSGCYQVLDYFDVEPDLAIGHSYGELTALHVAGFYDQSAFFTLSRLRGELMGQGEGDRGAMLAVVADIQRVKSLLVQHHIKLVVANHNAPEQVVLSGASEQVDAFSEIAKAEKIRTVRLPVAAAFHSEFVADAAKPFAKAVSEVQFQKNHIPVLSNTTTNPYPGGIDSQKKLLAEQLANPVRFVEQVEKLYAEGVRTFIEVGPGKTLTGLVDAILKDRIALTLAVDASRGKQQGQHDLACVLAAVAATGKGIALDKWDAACAQLERPDPDAKPALTVSINGANIVQRRPQRPPRQPAIKQSNDMNMTTTTDSSSSTPSGKTTAQQQAKSGTAVSPDLLQATQQSILALQKMQEQTARLHQQYLEGQETAQKTIHTLLQQQQALLAGGRLPTVSLPEPVAPIEKPVPATSEPAPVVATKTPVKEIQETINHEKPAAKQDVDIHNLLLKVVSEKTGYPLEMLSLDMSLDTDLGIDSIKRVEILSALQEELPWSPVIKPEELGTFQFLQHIVEFVAAGRPDSIETAASVPKQTSVASAGSDFDAALLQIVADKTGYPLEMLELDMNLDSDLGIDSVKRVEILSALQEAIPGLPAVGAEELGQLQTLRSITELLASGQRSAVAPATPPAADTGAPSGLAESLLEVVADKTGYPVDMLNLEMQLDSDLGIDSIKRVEILSALQERMPGLPTVSADELVSMQTLQTILDMFAVTDKAVALYEPANPPGHLSAILLEVVADKTGYPADMLNLEMQLDSDLGIDSIKRVEILSALQERMPELPTVSADVLSSIQTLQQIIDYMQAESSSASVPKQVPAVTEVSVTEPEAETTLFSPERLIRSIVKLEPVASAGRKALQLDKNKPVYVTDNGSEIAEQIVTRLKQRGYAASCIDLDDRPAAPLGGLVICAPAAPDNQFLINALGLLQHCAPALKNSHGLLASVTMLGGGFGFESSMTNSAMQAGLLGLVKTADKEWPNVHCKCIDIDVNAADSTETLVEELLLKGPLEVGLRNGKSVQPVLTEATLAEPDQPHLLHSDDVVVISGGARGVTAEVAVELARTYRCKFLLLGRSPQPETEPDWLQDITDEASIKQRLLAHAETKLKPAELESQYKAVLANREILANLQRIELAGGSALYYSADIIDAAAVANAIDLARAELGDVSGIIHAAGVLADRLIEDKTPEQFAQVFNTKVNGLQNLLAATAQDELKVLVLFSSTTARLGRKGQVDYACANEVLNKLAQHEQLQRQHCKVVSVNWGPWDGGMVTPALKKIFADEGVGVIGLCAGAEYLVNEIESSGPVETVVLGAGEHTPGTAPGRQYKDSHFALAFERELSVSSYAFLRSHVMNGQAVLPVAVIIEWFAHGALHLNPGMQFHGFDDFRVMKGVTLNADEKIQLRILAGHMLQQGDVALVPVELRSDRFVHAAATIVLSDTINKSVLPKLEPVTQAYQDEQGAYYQNGQLFHGHHLQGIKQVTHCSEEGIVADVNVAPSPSSWMSQPIRSSWLTDPLALDSAFQMMILWSFEQQGIGSLPTAIARYRQYQRSFPASGVKVVAQVEAHSAMQARAAIEFLDENGRLVALIDGYECVRDSSLQKAFKANDLSLQD